MKICFMKSIEACDRYRPECRQIVANLEECEVTSIPSEADVIVQFFCVETDECIREAAWQLRYIGKLKKTNSKVIVAGCAANVLGKAFLQFPEVDYVIQRKPVAKTVLEILGYHTCENKYFLGDNEPFDISLEISHGCQKKCGPCSFCFNGMTKIPVRSKPMDYLLEAVKNSTDAGARRVELLALNTCNYGIDFPEHKPLLHNLIRRISENDDVKIIDVYSLTIANMYPELLRELIDNPKVKLVEIGIQSGSDHLLELMNTGTTVQEIEQLLQAVLPHKLLKTIIIVGHPGETEEDFSKTMDLVKKYNLWYIQVNPFIYIEGTKSGQMKQIPKEVINERYARATKIVAEMRKKYLDGMIGNTFKGHLDRVYDYRDGTRDITIEGIDVPITFNYTCTVEEFEQKFENKDVYDVVSFTAKKVISYDASFPSIDVSDIEG